MQPISGTLCATGASLSLQSHSQRAPRLLNNRAVIRGHRLENEFDFLHVCWHAFPCVYMCTLTGQESVDLQRDCLQSHFREYFFYGSPKKHQFRRLTVHLCSVWNTDVQQIRELWKSQSESSSRQYLLELVQKKLSKSIV